MPLRSLTPMLVAGDAITIVNPAGLIGGEAVRMSLLQKVAPTPTALASVPLAAMTQFVAQVLFVVSGLPAALPLIADAALRRSLLALTAALLAGLVLVLLLAFRRAGLEWIKRSLGRIGWLAARWARLPESWRALVSEAVRTVRERPRSFALSVGASLLGWQAGVIETFVILKLLRNPVGWSQAYAIEALTVVIEGAFFFVPAKMGTQEGGKVLIFLAMGMPPAKGLALGFVRRLRELAWVIPGLAVLASSRRS